MSAKLNSVKLNSLGDDNWENVITADVPKGNFIAVVSSVLAEGSTQRVVTVEEMELEQAPGGNVETNSGMYAKTHGETSIKIILTDDGKEIDSTETNYPS